MRAWRRATARLALAAVVTAGVAACGDSAGPANVLPASLVGSWIAEPACLPACGLVVRSDANPQDSLAVTALLGVSAQIDMSAAGGFQLATLPPIAGGTLTGTARVEGQELVVTSAAGVVERLPYTVTATTLTLEFSGELDFSGDGSPEPATARGVFVRR